MLTLTREVLAGRQLCADDDLQSLVDADLRELTDGADEIRKKFCGSRVNLCSIINGRGGLCGEDCRFCAQSAHHHTGCREYGIPELSTFTGECRRAAENGLDRFSIVTAGRTLEGEDLEKLLAAYRAMHEAFPDMTLCASHGLMTEEDLKKLKHAGVTVYHANLETSEEFFPRICTTHTYEDKLLEIKRARMAGLSVCSGGILGMGENWRDRLQLALLLARLEVSSIPLNFLIPIPGTPLGGQRRLERDEILRIVAIFRHINPKAWIRIAAGRNYFDNGGAALFSSGANASITGDMLTTVGNSTAQDREMLKSMGFVLKDRSERN